MTEICIYKMVNPLNKKPFYVGATKNPKRREKLHWYNAKSETVMNLRLFGEKPYLVEIGWCKKSEASAQERYWINKIRKMGFKLENKNVGGYWKRKKMSPLVKRNRIIEKIRNSDTYKIAMRVSDEIVAEFVKKNKK